MKINQGAALALATPRISQMVSNSSFGSALTKVCWNAVSSLGPQDKRNVDKQKRVWLKRVAKLPRLA